MVPKRCKPYTSYYQGILDALGLKASECIMIGNDPEIDIPEDPQLRSQMRSYLMNSKMCEVGVDSMPRKAEQSPAVATNSQHVSYCKKALQAGAHWAGTLPEMLHVLDEIL